MIKCTQHGVFTHYTYDPYLITWLWKKSILEALWGYIGKSLINLRKMKVT